MNTPMVNWLKYCEHVYRTIIANPCPICGGDTHETDWALIAKQRREHRDQYGLFYTVKEWWSI